MSLITNCLECSKSFKSRTTLLKHYAIKHQGLQEPGHVNFIDKEGIEAQVPSKDVLTNSQELVAYKQWLGGIVESINESLHPELPGKWITLNIWQVKPAFLSQLIIDMKALPDNVRNASHKKKPFYRKSARRISYKVYDLGMVQAALTQQNVTALKAEVLYANEKEIIRQPESDAASLLAAAKQRAFVRRSVQAVANETPSQKCSIVVKESCGRISREFELIWWPDLYRLSGLGKLDIRFYLEKTSL